MRTPTMTRIVARTGRNTLSGTRALRWLPKKMPGREPMTSEPSSPQSTDPKSQWPTPAIKVSSTAWAMSGADETGDRSARVELNESRHPDGTGTDRGERYPSAPLTLGARLALANA